MKKDLRGSGSKENVGRKKIPYSTTLIRKAVPTEIYDKCLSLIDAEKLKFKNKMKNIAVILFALLALLLTSCSEDEPQTNGGVQIYGYDYQVYESVIYSGSQTKPAYKAIHFYKIDDKKFDGDIDTRYTMKVTEETNPKASKVLYVSGGARFYLTIAESEKLKIYDGVND